MRVLVCGGREFGDIDRELQHYEPDNWLVRKREKEFGFVWNSLDSYIARLYYPNIVIISGCAWGPDTIAIQWADTYGLEVEKYPADWKKYGKRAGFIRNKQMLDEGKPDLVVAFPGGKGTAMMVDIARKAGIEVIQPKYES